VTWKKNCNCIRVTVVALGHVPTTDTQQIAVYVPVVTNFCHTYPIARSFLKFSDLFAVCFVAEL
jgi:hypothetical protein